MSDSQLITTGIVAGLGGFVALWCLITTLIGHWGWRRLAQYRALPPLPTGPRITPWRSRIGSVRYKNVIKAGALAEGLALEVALPFRPGHPPLLIPWSAIGPLRVEHAAGFTFFGDTFFNTTIRTDDGSVDFTFNSEQLAQAMKAWLRR